MVAAVIRSAGQAPVYQEFKAPVPQAGESLISMRAAALSQLARARAFGTHYSSSGGFPFVADVDGVGTTPDRGRVYFVLPRAPYGAMAEQAVAPAGNVLSVPDGLDGRPGRARAGASCSRCRRSCGVPAVANAGSDRRPACLVCDACPVPPLSTSLR